MKMHGFSFLRGNRSGADWRIEAYSDPLSRWRVGFEAFDDRDGGWRGLQLVWLFVGLSWDAPHAAAWPA